MLAIRLLSEIFTVCCDTYNRQYRRNARADSAVLPMQQLNATNSQCHYENLVIVIVLNSILDCSVCICENFYFYLFIVTCQSNNHY
jgi:hypothetical protein